MSKKDETRTKYGTVFTVRIQADERKAKRTRLAKRV